jgi:hypothetical protein
LSAGEILSFFALLVAVAAIGLSFLTLLIVAWQGWVAKRTLDVTRRTLDATQLMIQEDRRFRQLDKLDSVGWIITVTGSLKRWLKELERKRRILQYALDHDQPGRVKEVAYGGCVSPHGLISKPSYDTMPIWLQALWDAGAQHYYNADHGGMLRHLWDEDKQAARLTFVRSVCERLDDSIHYLRELLSYIHDIVPDSYLEAPASIDDREFRKPWDAADRKAQHELIVARDA